MITLLRDRDGFYWEFNKYGEDRRAPVDGFWISEERAEINGIEVPDGYDEGLTELLKRYGPADVMQAVSRCFWSYHTERIEYGERLGFDDSQ